MTPDDERPRSEEEPAGIEPTEPEDDDGDPLEAAFPDMGDLLAQIGAASEQLSEVVDEASEVIVEGSSAGGSVVVQLTGSLEAISVRIDPQLVDPADVATLEDAVLAALRDALTQALEFREELEEELEDGGVDLSALLGRLGGQLGSLGLPSLGNVQSPEDLLAGLTGALGSLPGGLGGSLGGGLPNLNDIMAGLGLSGPTSQPSGSGAGPDTPPGETAGESHGDTDGDSDGEEAPGAAAEDPPVTVFAGPIQELVDELGRLPGIGPKSAQRIAFHLLEVSKEEALRLAATIADVKDRIRLCERCFNVGEGAMCAICSDARRDSSIVCVVEDPRDIVAVERTREFHGTYHVLGGALNPIEGVGPDQLRVRDLLSRLGPENVSEVILCTNPNLEGEATAMYLARLLGPLGVKVTRIASGLPVGGDLEYADELTLGRALVGRREMAK